MINKYIPRDVSTMDLGDLFMEFKKTPIIDDIITNRQILILVEFKRRKILSDEMLMTLNIKMNKK